MCRDCQDNRTPYVSVQDDMGSIVFVDVNRLNYIDNDNASAGQRKCILDIYQEGLSAFTLVFANVKRANEASSKICKHWDNHHNKGE